MGEGFGADVFQYRAGALDDDGAVVVGAIDEMDGAAADFAAVGEDGFMDTAAVHAFSAEAGEQRGVDVHHAAMPLGGDVEQTEPAGQADEVHGRGVDELENSAAE